MFGFDTLAVPKQNVCTHEIDQSIPVLAGDALQWPAMSGTYLEVLGCLGAAMVDWPGGVVDFNTVVLLGTELTLVLVNVKGLGGAGVLRGPIDSNRSFPVMFSIVLTALETLRHMLDFRSSVSCLGFGKQTCGWAIWITIFAMNLVTCLAVKVNV